MKNVNLFTFNRSEAQKNTSCASVNISNASPRRYRDVTETLPRRYGWAKLAATLTLLLTLSGGQMWADNGDFYNMYLSYTFEGAAGAVDGSDNNTGVSVDAGTLTSGSLILTGVYLKCWDDWGSNYKSEGGQLCYTNKGGSTQYVTGLSRSGKSGNNYEYQKSNVGLTIASYNQASGSFSFESWGQTWGGNWGDRYFPKSSGHYTINYKIAPPAVSSYSVSTTGSNILSGSGTSGDPYIIAYKGTLSLSITGSKHHTDGNSSAQYYNTNSNNAWSTTSTKSISSITSTTKTSVTVKMRYYNSTAKIGGTESSTTIYYKSEASYTVTVNNDGHGTTSPSGAQSNIGQSIGVAVSATASTNYEFVNWTITSGSGTFTGGGTSSTTASTRFYPSANATIRANFRSTATYSLTVSAGPGISSVTGSTDPVTLGNSYAITATPLTGYTFNTWTASPAANGSFTSATSASTNVAVSNGSVTVTASATENMSTLSTSNHYDVGNPSYAAPSVSGSATTVGYATTRTITAAAAGTGYRFVGWTLTNCTRTDGGGATANPITIRSNGDGAAASVVANYEEVLTTTFYISGATSARSPFTGWGASGTPMFKKTGHSTEEIYYCTITVSNTAGDGEFEFKPYNSTGDVHYGHDNYWVTQENHADIPCWGDNVHSLWFKPYVTGDYEFKIDNTGSYPELTVTWPVYNQVRISAASPTDATNTGNFDLSDPVSNVRSVKRTLKANTTYTFKIMYNSDWYGYNSGTFTRSTSTSSNSLTLNTSGGDLTLTTDYAGDYTFKFNQSTKALSVDFPTAYKVTYGKGTVDGSSGSCSAKDIDNGNAAVTSNSTWVKSGNRVVLTAPAAKTGYTYDGWFDNNSGTGAAITTNANCTITVSSALTRYACYTINNYAITHSDASHGTYTIKVGSAAAVSTNTTSDYGKTITLAATPATGYHFGSWSAYKTGTPATTITVTSNQFTMPDYAVTVGATFTPNTYRVQFHRNGASEATVYQNFTYDVAQNLTTNTYTRTGYTLAGWATSTSGEVVYDDGEEVSNLTSENDATFHLYAKWTPKTYTVTLSQTGAETTGTPSVTATYAADMPAMTSPTAANGYAFMGYFTAENGGGTKYYNANGTSARTWNIDVNPTTLYAWFKKAEITTLTFDPAIVAPNTTIKVTPTIEPTPTGDTHIEWRVLYDNNNPLDPQPTLTTYGTGKQFTSMTESGIYKVEATLRTGTTVGSGTVLHTQVASFQVAGNHTVTIRYKCDDYVVTAPTTVTGEPLEWSSNITAPNVTGYTFQYWTLGDGITLKDGQTTGDDNTPGTNPINIKATYDGTLTANYVKKQMIYFNNTLGWSDVWVYFYNDGSGNNYWVDNYGTGANQKQYFSGNAPFYEGESGQMTRIEGTNIWYFDFKEAGYNTTRTKVAFANKNQKINKTGATNTEAYFYQAQAVYRTDFDATNLPMFVPLTTVSHDYSSKEVKTKYYNNGYWMNYPDNTGYWLKIFSGIDGSPSVVKDIPFEFSADKTMPMDLYVDLEANYTYGFKIYKADNKWYGNNSTMTANTTNWEMTETYKDGNQTKPTKNCGLTTTAAGTYRFNLYYLDNNSDKNYQYRVGVTYPVGAGDFRIVYTDGAKWSQSTAHTGTWSHPSAIITKNSSSTAVKRDTVSFYWAYGSSPVIKSQKCSSVGTGTVSWGSTTSINVSSYSSVLNKKGVYNFIFEQPQNGGSISLVGVEPYTGDFYIRTDCAGSTKWDNYKALDHMMQYSDYAATNEGFTHYYAHWVERSKNIKFVIANDYSPCVSDTLVQDVDVNFGNMESDGTLKSDGAGEAFRDKYSANIRFMYDVNNNKLSRAYISSATDIAKKFLVMRGNGANGKGHIFNEAGQELTTAGGGKIADLDEYEMSFVDDQNFIYETKIKANPTALVKLYAKYCGKSQELKGDTSTTFNTTGNHAIEILGGTYAAATKELMRIVYDFKTNRLVCAWLPSDSEISGELDINADVMIIREHQDEAQQIKFAHTGDKLKDVKSVYGVMRFNRWTLANKDKSTHNPLASPKSNYERQIYFISFPFDVNLGDIFGLSAYDDLWWIEYYDGAERAEKGYFQETKSFWKFMENTPTAKLEANKGYILKLDAAMLNSSNTNIWTNNIEQVELFFPSAYEVEEIEKQNASITLDPLPCTKNINPAGSKEPEQDGYVAEKDRRKRDSHWYCIGVPSYANYSEYVTDAEGNNLSWSTWGPKNQGEFPFLYTWNMTDNTLSPTASAKYGFKTMNAYMVQYAGTINWAAASAPKSIAARRNANWKSSYMFRLELQKENQKTEQTLINLSDAENVSAAFDFNYDLSNEGGAIYTTTSDLVTVAGNCLPLVTDQQTTVPVGVIAKTTGEYTFAMPDGTEGLSVTLVDNFTGAHTNLALGDYTVELEAGTYEERFTLVIDPRTTTTAVETVGGESVETAPRKVFINGLMYIQRGSNLYDAQGRKVN